MKQTDFRFELRLATDDPQATLSGLKTKIRSIKGINSVTSSGSDCVVELTLNASLKTGSRQRNCIAKL